MAIFGSSWKDDSEDVNMFSHWKYEDDSPEPSETLKSAKERYDEWDVTLMDGLEYESWDELYDDYVGEADLHEFIKWIKKHFHVPVKL